MSKFGHDNPITATLSGIWDLFSKEGQLSPLPVSVRLDGKTCLVTGSNTGLGKAIAIDLASRGGHVIMACRSGIPDAGEDVKRESGSQNVRMVRVDLGDLDDVNRLCDELAAEKVNIDIAILNAGLMPKTARKSSQGFEMMFAVHYMANRLLVTRLLNDGVIQKNKAARIVFVSSDAHRSAKSIDFDRFGDFVDYGLAGGMAQYGYSKLVLNLYAGRLAEDLAGKKETPQVGIHYICPGPVKSNIARETPAWLKPLLVPMMSLFFREPKKAAEPVVLLACSPAFEKRTGIYMHMLREKLPSEQSLDANNRAQVWDKGAALLKGYL